MRKWIAAIGLLVLAVSAWGSSTIGLAETPAPSAQPRTIEVVGKGTVTAEPDTAVITLGVSALAETPSMAFRDASKTMENIATALLEVGLKRDELKTSELNLGPEYNWTQEKGQVLKGYRATSNVTVTTQQLSKIAAIVEAATVAGANQMHSLSFTVKDPEGLAEQAMDLAADNAREKAVRVAKRMGATVTRVLKITVMDESGPIYRAPAAYDTMAKSEAAAMPVFSGTSKITVSISATFEIE